MKLIIIFVIKYDFYIHNNAFDCEKYIIVKNTHTHTYICKMHIVLSSAVLHDSIGGQGQWTSLYT